MGAQNLALLSGHLSSYKYMSSASSRRIFFWSLAVFFFFTTALVIFYASGYRFSFERGIFIYGGSVTIKSNPRQISIKINNEPVSQKKLNFINGSYHIDGIRPGEYLLEVTAPGFQSWSKKIAVHSGISTEFWNVLLAKNQYPKTEFYISSEKKFYMSPKNDYVAYIQNQEQEFTVSILDPSSNESSNIFSSDKYAPANDDKENIKWAPQSHAVIIPAIEKETGVRHYFIVDVDTKKTINLKDLAQAENIGLINWDSDKKDAVYYLSDKNLYRLDLNNPDDKKQIARNVASYDIASGKLYYFQLPGGIVYETGLSGEQPPAQITTTPPADLSDTDYKIIAYDKDRIAFINDKLQKLYIWNKGEQDTYFRELSSDALGIQFSDDGKKLLFWNRWGIFVYFARKWDDQPARSENEVLGITRFSIDLGNVQWSKDYEHVIFSVDKKIKITELDRRDYCNIMDIAALESDEGFVTGYFPDEKLYYTDKSKEDSSSFNLFSVDFPEKTGILGSI